MHVLDERKILGGLLRFSNVLQGQRVFIVLQVLQEQLADEVVTALT